MYLKKRQKKMEKLDMKKNKKDAFFNIALKKI